MHNDDIRRAVEAERLDLAGVLDGLGPVEWTAPSLCDGWTVRDVVAHLTLATRLTLRAVLVGALRARGDVDRAIGDSARQRAARFPPTELVAQLRETAGSSRRPPGARPMDPLVDVMVHGQDITRPLGRARAMRPDLVEAALDHVWRSAFYGTRRRFRGLRLVATDIDWTAGEGTEVRGPAEELLLLATGRAAALAAIDGPGREEVAYRLAPEAPGPRT